MLEFQANEFGTGFNVVRKDADVVTIGYIGECGFNTTFVGTRLSVGELRDIADATELFLKIENAAWGEG